MHASKYLNSFGETSVVRYRHYFIFIYEHDFAPWLLELYIQYDRVIYISQQPTSVLSMANPSLEHSILD